MASSVTPESFFALREPDGAQISLQEHIYGRPSDSVTRRVLLAMTALAFICVRRPTNESYAAALYISTDGSGENPTVLLSGVGPIPDATMDFVQTAILPQLRRRSRDRTWSTPKDYTAALRELFTTIALFTSERLRERAHCGDKDTWQHRVDRTRAWISADYLETFNLLVSKLDELKKFASVLEQTRGTERAEPVQYVLFFLSVELDRFLVEERTRLMLSLVDSGIRGAGDVSQIVKSRTPTLDVTQCVEDGDGGLIKGGLRRGNDTSIYDPPFIRLLLRPLRTQSNCNLSFCNQSVQPRRAATGLFPRRLAADRVLSVRFPHSGNRRDKG